MNRLRFLPRSPGISRLILAGDRRALLAPEIALPGRLAELRALMEACQGRYRDVVPVLALAGLRWGESASLQVGDRVSIPGPGLRLRRTVLASGGGGALYVDTLKNNRGRTVPLVLDLVPIVDHWSAGKAPDAWLFEAPHGGPLRERVNGTTKSGRTRVVSMDDETVAVLRQRKADQAAEQLKAGDSWRGTKDGHLFTTGWGEPIYPDTVTSLMTKLIRASKQLPHARLHGLRHLHATTLLLSGVPVHVVAARLGHADPAITLRVYAHVIRSAEAAAADIFADAVNAAC